MSYSQTNCIEVVYAILKVFVMFGSRLSLFVCLFVFLVVCLFVCLFVCDKSFSTSRVCIFVCKIS